MHRPSRILGALLQDPLGSCLPEESKENNYMSENTLFKTHEFSLAQQLPALY